MKTNQTILVASVARVLAALVGGPVASLNAQQGANNHAVMLNAPQTVPTQKVFLSTGTQETPLVGHSQSGAASVLVVQDTHFDSPALVVRREGESGDTTDTPTMLITAGGETLPNKPVFQVGGCLALSGDNWLIYWGDGSMSLPGGFRDNTGATQGKVSIDPVHRQLVGTDGITARLTWTDSDVQIPRVIITERVTFSGDAVVEGLKAAHISDASAKGRAILISPTAAGQRGELELGTAATLNVAATGDAAGGEVVKGNDSRLSNVRTPTAHTHVAADISDATAAGRAILVASDAAAQRAAMGVAPARAVAELTGTAIPLAADGSYFKTISVATGFTFSGSVQGAHAVLALTTTDDVQPGWPPEVAWPGGAAPVQAASSTVVYEFRAIGGTIFATSTQY